MVRKIVIHVIGAMADLAKIDAGFIWLNNGQRRLLRVSQVFLTRLVFLEEDIIEKRFCRVMHPRA
jgi:hypothetical protein